MSEPISSILGTTMQNIKEMVDVNTIIGEPITAPDGSIIIPVSKVAFGFASGGSEFAAKNDKMPFGGGAGAGVNITPIAFLVIANGNVRLLQIGECSGSLDRLISMIPDIADKVKDFIPSKKEEEELY